MLTIRGKSDRACFICGIVENTREVKSAEFTGTLCMKHIADKTKAPAPKKNGKDASAEVADLVPAE